MAPALRNAAVALLCVGVQAQDVAHDGSPCVGPDNTYPDNYFEMNFFKSTLTINNLGGVTPDGFFPSEQEVIKYANIGVYNGYPVDMIVSNLTEYKPNNPNNNGYGANDVFGEINLGGNSDSMDEAQNYNSVRLKYQFVNGETQAPIEIVNLGFSFFPDVVGQGEKGRECLVVHTPQTETIYSADHALSIETDDDGRESTFCSTEQGVGADNPSNPNQVDFTGTSEDYVPFITNHAVSFNWALASEIEITYRVHSRPEGESSRFVATGRNFLFSGWPTQTLPDCESPPPPPPPLLPPAAPICYPCTDTPSSSMQTRDPPKVCDAYPYAYANLCNHSSTWRKERYCEISCDANGSPYDGVCCKPPLPPSPPPSPPSPLPPPPAVPSPLPPPLQPTSRCTLQPSSTRLPPGDGIRTFNQAPLIAWDSDVMREAWKLFAVDNVRWPAGTFGNYFYIPTGRMHSKCDASSGSGVTEDQALFGTGKSCNKQTALDAYSHDAFMLNNTAALWEADNMSTTWHINVYYASADQIKDQIIYLHSQGYDAYRIEFGNELFMKTYRGEFPTSTVLMEKILPALKLTKQLFPNAKRAVPVAYPWCQTARFQWEDEWNEQIVPYLDHLEAVVVHEYRACEDILDAVAPELESRKRVGAWLAHGRVSYATIYRKLHRAFSEADLARLEIWITEYGAPLWSSQPFYESGPLEHRSYGYSGMMIIAWMMTMWSGETRITHGHAHNLIGDGDGDEDSWGTTSGYVRYYENNQTDRDMYVMAATQVVAHVMRTQAATTGGTRRIHPQITPGSTGAGGDCPALSVEHIEVNLADTLDIPCVDIIGFYNLVAGSADQDEDRPAHLVAINSCAERDVTLDLSTIDAISASWAGYTCTYDATAKSKESLKAKKDINTDVFPWTGDTPLPPTCSSIENNQWTVPSLSLAMLQVSPPPSSPAANCDKMVDDGEACGPGDGGGMCWHCCSASGVCQARDRNGGCGGVEAEGRRTQEALSDYSYALLDPSSKKCGVRHYGKQGPKQCVVNPSNGLTSCVSVPEGYDVNSDSPAVQAMLRRAFVRTAQSAGVPAESGAASRRV